MYALTTHQLQVETRESHRDDQVYALTTHQLQVERRESHRDDQVDEAQNYMLLAEEHCFGHDVGCALALLFCAD